MFTLPSPLEQIKTSFNDLSSTASLQFEHQRWLLAAKLDWSLRQQRRAPVSQSLPSGHHQHHLVDQSYCAGGGYHQDQQQVARIEPLPPIEQDQPLDLSIKRDVSSLANRSKLYPMLHTLPVQINKAKGLSILGGNELEVRLATKSNANNPHRLPRKAYNHNSAFLPSSTRQFSILRDRSANLNSFIDPVYSKPPRISNSSTTSQSVQLTTRRSPSSQPTGKQQRPYTETDLAAAVRAICFGRLGTRRAAAVYGIPRSTLRNKICKLNELKRREEQKLGGDRIGLGDYLQSMLNHPTQSAEVDQLQSNATSEQECGKSVSSQTTSSKDSSRVRHTAINSVASIFQVNCRQNSSMRHSTRVHSKSNTLAFSKRQQVALSSDCIDLEEMINGSWGQQSIVEPTIQDLNYPGNRSPSTLDVNKNETDNSLHSTPVVINSHRTSAFRKVLR